VSEDLNFVPFVVALLGAGVGIVGGYFVGVAQSRNERRDNALAEISKEMMLFYRSVVAWTGPKQTYGPLTAPNTSWRDYCRRQYEAFLNAFYGNGIWLSEDTSEMIQEVAEASRVFLNGVDPHGRLMSDGTSASDWRAKNVLPKVNKVQDALQAEITASRSIIPYRIVIKKNALDTENRG